MKRQLFARWWYVRSDQRLDSKRGIEPIGYTMRHAGDDIFVAGGPLPKRWFIENAERLTTWAGVKHSISLLRRHPGNTNIRAVRVTVWQKKRERHER